LWDRAFSLARTINPMDEDVEACQTFPLAVASDSNILQCPITQKVHTMLRHVQWQMKSIPGGGGLGDKMEDCLHQWGMRQRKHFCTVQDPLVCALAREKATSRNIHPTNVLAQVDAADEGNNKKLTDKKADVKSTRQKLQRNVGRFQAIKYFNDISKRRH
jgi:hypothetical protein